MLASRAVHNAGIVGYGKISERSDVEAEGEDIALLEFQLEALYKTPIITLEELEQFFPVVPWADIPEEDKLPPQLAEVLVNELDKRARSAVDERIDQPEQSAIEVFVESVEVITNARKGQDGFRKFLRDRALSAGLDPACEVCGFDDFGLLDAAHITSFASVGPSDSSNGALLCATHHRALDRRDFVLSGSWPNRKAIYAQGVRQFRTVSVP